MVDESVAIRSKMPFLSQFSLSGKLALITGGSRGIGRRIAFGLAEAGGDIVLTARKRAGLE